jgi:hypothetical protein
MEEYIDKIIEKGNKEDMEELSAILIKVVDNLDDEKKEKVKKKLYEMAYGKVLTKEMAEEVVHNMKPYGEFWDIDATTEVKKQYGINNITDVDFYVVMNMIYNDDKETIDRFVVEEHKLDMYVGLAKDFVLDVDGKKDKVYDYFA